MTDKAQILKTIIENACEVLPHLEEHNFQPDDALKNLGANSIDRSEIVMMTLESLSLNIPLVEMAAAENIGELSEIIYEKQ